MNPVLFQDTHEPVEIFNLLKQSIEVVVGPLNVQGKADYYWVDIKDWRRQWERKQVAEALGDLDSVEEQLNRELETCEELTLVVEGVMLPTPRGVQTYKLVGKDKKRMFIPFMEIPVPSAKPQPGLFSRWQSLKTGLKAAGVEVVETNSIEGTVAALVAAFKGSMKEEHTTLKRYLRPHIPPFSPNVHIDNLARLKGTRIGPELASRLVEKYGTLYEAVNASRSELVQILGPGRTSNFLKGIGRE